MQELNARETKGSATGSEREQKDHTRKDCNPLVDGRGSVRLMRGSIGRG